MIIIIYYNCSEESLHTKVCLQAKVNNEANSVYHTGTDYSRAQYSRTSIIQVPLCQLNHKNVQISEFVWMNEYTELCWNTLIQHTPVTNILIEIHLLTKYSNRTVTATVWINQWDHDSYTTWAIYAPIASVSYN